jgi:hypothetical protein
MYSNLFNRNNYIVINTDLISILGLEGAIYYSEISTIYSKAKEKNKIIGDNFIKVDRKYVQKKTSISIEKQIELDNAWTQISLIKVDESDKNIIQINEDVVFSLLESSKKEVKKISKYLKPKYESKDTNKAKTMEEIKAKISHDDLEVVKELNRYVDAVSQLNPKIGSLTIQSFEIFQEDLLEFTKGNTKIYRELIRLGTKFKTFDTTWIIRKYKTELKNDKKLLKSEPVTTQETAQATLPLSNLKF